jgi:hypothetical protein
VSLEEASGLRPLDDPETAEQNCFVFRDMSIPRAQLKVRGVQEKRKCTKINVYRGHECSVERLDREALWRSARRLGQSAWDHSRWVECSRPTQGHLQRCLVSL